MIKKLCWWCKHFTYYSGSPEYSEYTPGCDIELLCAKNHWKFNSIHTNEIEFRNILMSAEKCSDYERDSGKVDIN